MVKFFRFDLFEFINHDKVTFFPLPSPIKTCALPFDFTLERDPKNIFNSQSDVENYTDQVLNFLLYDGHEYIHTQNLLVCNSGQYISVTSLHNVLQDLIDRISSYFQRIAFQRNLLLIGF